MPKAVKLYTFFIPWKTENIFWYDSCVLIQDVLEYKSRKLQIVINLSNALCHYQALYIKLHVDFLVGVHTTQKSNFNTINFLPNADI